MVVVDSDMTVLGARDGERGDWERKIDPESLDGLQAIRSVDVGVRTPLLILDTARQARR